MTEFYAVYDLATGTVRWTGQGPEGACTAQVLPAGAGVMMLSGEAYRASTASDARQLFVANGTIGTRTAISLPAMTALVGEAVTVPVPAGVNWTVDGSFYIGPKALTFSTAGVRQVTLVGRSSGTMALTVTTLADAKSNLVLQVKDEAERRRMLVMSPGGSKKSVYASKAVEVENWNTLGGVGATAQVLLAALNALNTTTRARKFRYAIRDAAMHGDTVDKAIARFTAGSDRSQEEAARIEAIEQTAVDRIRAASTLPAATAAFTAINWSAT